MLIASIVAATHAGLKSGGRAGVGAVSSLACRRTISLLQVSLSYLYHFSEILCKLIIEKKWDGNRIQQGQQNSEKEGSSAKTSFGSAHIHPDVFFGLRYRVNKGGRDRGARYKDAAGPGTKRLCHSVGQALQAEDRHHPFYQRDQLWQGVDD
jgi:hypothetical protein